MRLVKFILITTMVILTGCDPALNRQPKLKPYATSDFFANQSAARDPVPGTVPFLQKKVIAAPISREMLLLGQNKYNIYCTPCHGYAGHGDGMVVERGFPKPAKFQLLSALPAQAIANIILSGTANMPSFSSKLSAEERWAVANYVKALQLRENFPKKLLSQKDLEHLNKESR